MRDSSSSYGVSFGRPLARDPWANGIQPDHNTFGSYYMSGLGESPTPTPDPQSLGELQPVGWIITGAVIGWASSAYATGNTTENEQALAAWGGGSTAILLLGLRKLINGDQAGLGPTLLGLTLGAAGFYFGASKRDNFLGM